MFTNDQALEACRALRPLLPQLVPDLADQIDPQLAQLLNQPDLEDNSRVDRLVAVVDAYPETKRWFDQFLDHLTPKGGFAGLAGDPAFSSAPAYLCPVGNDYTWYREGNEDVPLCPTHLVSLVRPQTKIGP